MSRMTAHQQLRRTSPAKGYVAGRCNASTVVQMWIPATRWLFQADFDDRLEPH